MNTRRSFLAAGVLIGGGALIGGGLHYRGQLNDRKLAQLLTSFLDYADLAKSTGKRILNTDTSLNQPSFDRLIDDLLNSVETSRGEVLNLTRESLLQKLHERIKLDFIEENIVIVDGWILSKTEASMCVLAYQLPREALINS